MICDQYEKNLIKQDKMHCKKCGCALTFSEISNNQSTCNNCKCVK